MKTKSISVQDAINHSILIQKKSYKNRHKHSKLEQYDEFIFDCLKSNCPNHVILTGLIMQNKKFSTMARSTLSRYIRKHYANVRQG